MHSARGILAEPRNSSSRQDLSLVPTPLRPSDSVAAFSRNRTSTLFQGQP